MVNKTRTMALGIILIAFFALIFLFLGYGLWINSIKPALTDYVTYIGYITLGGLALFTSSHLWSRVPDFERGSSIRTLFMMMGVSFIVIFGLFFYYILNAMFTWSVIGSLSAIINSVLPGGGVNFNLFDIKSVPINMPLDSIVTFALIMIGVSFYIWPLERYVKSRRPWFAISLWLCLLAIPFLAIFQNNTWVVSIATAGIVLFVVINFIFLFYLYISLAVKSAGHMRRASVFVAFGLILMITVWIVRFASSRLGTFYSAIIQFSVGILSMTLFNLGFYIMRG
ncbi:MAG TPA: hypothetical protein VKM55_27270 [Candidatus Lokiarchaeia archaeon]|nr:hypothetical protein [Candidatus Lokiarchaeia archaeon]